MRRKKNLEERLSACSECLFSMDIEDKNFLTSVEEKEYFDCRVLFGNSSPVHLEVGCGKGQFICEIARQNPDVNFIAVEKSANVIVQACEKAIEEGLTNVKFIKGSAEYLTKYIPDGSIERIYLNFSCPFPKKKYAAHRLTHRRFLKIYKSLLAPGAEIHQKTDNMHFFEFSLQELTEFGFALKNVSLDLHNSDFTENIVTEYEQRFSDLGQPIYRLEAYLRKE